MDTKMTHQIRLVNLEHVTLHKEAWAAIEQAEVAGWGEALVVMAGGFYPRISFYKTGESHGLITDTVPGYMEQRIYNYADIKWNRPILTPAQVQSLKWLLDEAGRPQRPSGTIECCVCHAVIGFNPEINDISSGYCQSCGQVALAEAEVWIAQQTAKMLTEFTQAKATFATQVSEAIQ